MLGFFLKRINSLWVLDNNEERVLNFVDAKGGMVLHDNSTIIVQAPSDHYFLSLFAHAIKEGNKDNNHKIVGLWPTIFVVKQRRDLLFLVRVVYSWINSFFLKRKWMSLYRSIGITTFSIAADVSQSKKLKFFVEAILIWRKLKTKEELLALTINGIHCGDLIVDTYLRYRVRPTVNVKSLSTLYYIYVTLCAIHSSQKLADENISMYFSSYSTYIQHGIPVRVFLKSGITVYSAGNLQQRFKRLSLKDYYHTAAHRNYAETFERLDNKAEKIALGKKMLENKFSGNIDRSTSYMKTSAFQGATGQPELSLNFDGVLFLHDFYDSPHIYSSMLFVDFYEWVVHTFRLIEKHKLNIGIKPHPNQTEESRRDIKKLKQAFPFVKWIEPKTSNRKIFKSGISFGISIYGTVLHELAYHGINPICAGDNPHWSFDFVHKPKTVAEYDDLILKGKMLVLPPDYSDQVSAFYYMHNVHTKEDLPVNESLFNGYNATNGSSKLFLQVMTEQV